MCGGGSHLTCRSSEAGRWRSATDIPLRGHECGWLNLRSAGHLSVDASFLHSHEVPRPILFRDGIRPRLHDTIQRHLNQTLAPGQFLDNPLLFAKVATDNPPGCDQYEDITYARQPDHPFLQLSGCNGRPCLRSECAECAIG